jgi:hypothetical protein
MTQPLANQDKDAIALDTNFSTTAAVRGVQRNAVGYNLYKFLRFTES